MDIFESCLNLEPTQTTTTMTANEHCGDFLEDAANSPETHIEEGHKDGYRDGLISGRQNGYEVGLKHGFECGEEVGFYRGLVDFWTAAIQVDPNFFSGRVRKSVEQLKELLNDYPFMDPEDENKDVVTEKLRLKFRVICASLGVKLEYNGYPKMNHVQDY